MTALTQLERGQQFDGPGGTSWEVVKPVDTIKTHGESIPCVWLSEVDHPEENRWIECETFVNKVDNGDFELEGDR
ncbi:hypothetical protein [Halocatena marina]|uniref:hypothetical protein n=1 Tax=Halocatena marina TaxID=2934937 RepID=UPI00200CA6A1|nr:hypothetical protein [Halocatena marina]